MWAFIDLAWQIWEVENTLIIEEMNAIRDAVGGIHGYHGMSLNLKRRFGWNVNHKRISWLMWIARIYCMIRRNRSNYVRSLPQQITENILNRDFHTAELNRKWVTDVTELKYWVSQKAYLSAIFDLHDGSICSFVFGYPITINSCSINSSSPFIASERVNLFYIVISGFTIRHIL